MQTSRGCYIWLYVWEGDTTFMIDSVSVKVVGTGSGVRLFVPSSKSGQQKSCMRKYAASSTIGKSSNVCIASGVMTTFD